MDSEAENFAERMAMRANRRTLKDKEEEERKKNERRTKEKRERRIIALPQVARLDGVKSPLWLSSLFAVRFVDAF